MVEVGSLAAKLSFRRGHRLNMELVCMGSMCTAVLIG
jgi:hypothetical protein